MILGIDTTGEACSMALLDEGLGLVSSRFRLIGSGHAEALFPMMEELFKDAGISRNAVKRIIVTTGPGAFTGVRVGVSAARALGLGLSCPVHGISVFQLLAAQAVGTGPVPARLIVANDARRSQVYIQSFGKSQSIGRSSDGQLGELDQAKVISLEQFDLLLGQIDKAAKKNEAATKKKGRILLAGTAAGLAPKRVIGLIEARKLDPDMAALGDAMRCGCFQNNISAAPHRPFICDRPTPRHRPHQRG